MGVSFIEFLESVSRFSVVTLFLIILLRAIGFGASVLISSTYSGDDSRAYTISVVLPGKLYRAELIFSGVMTSSDTAASAIVGIKSC
jgi:hypothetical protein